MRPRPIDFYLNKYITSSDNILDVCCGIGKVLSRINKYNMAVGVDIFSKYIPKYVEYRNTIGICADIMKFIKFIDRSYDIILAFDSVEHLKENDALELINWMEIHYNKYLMVLTPNFFNTNDCNVKNAWRMGKNIYQKHRSYFPKTFWINRGYTLIEKYWPKSVMRKGVKKRSENYLYIKSK